MMFLMIPKDFMMMCALSDCVVVICYCHFFVCLADKIVKTS